VVIVNTNFDSSQTVAYQSLLKDIIQLKQDLDKVTKEIPQCEEGRLKDVLSNWLEEAVVEFTDIEQKAKEMQDSFVKLCIAFGEVPQNKSLYLLVFLNSRHLSQEAKSMQPDTLFNMLLKFLTNFDKALKDNQRLKAMAEREAARKAKEALSPKKKKSLDHSFLPSCLHPTSLTCRSISSRQRSARRRRG